MGDGAAWAFDSATAVLRFGSCHDEMPVMNLADLTLELVQPMIGTAFEVAQPGGEPLTMNLSYGTSGAHTVSLTASTSDTVSDINDFYQVTLLY